MPAPLSSDLRKRIVLARERDGQTLQQIADRFMVGHASVERVLARHKETGSVEPALHGGGPEKLLSNDDRAVLRELEAARPDATQDELALALEAKTGIKVSSSTISRELHGFGLTRKKKSGIARERCTREVEAEREAFVEQMQSTDPERLVFVDEAGTHIDMTRSYAWAPKGQRAWGISTRNVHAAISAIAAMGLRGIRALKTFRGGTTGERFKSFLDEDLGRQLKPGDIVILDGAGAHKAKGVRERIEARGASLVPLPPYSPDLNPIEHAWSKIKAILRTYAPRTAPLVMKAIRFAANLVTAENAAAWFKNARIVPQPV